MSAFSVTIPENIRPGEVFETLIDDHWVTIKCPPNKQPGNILHINVIKNEANEVISVNGNSISDNSFAKSSKRIHLVWICMDVVLFVLFTLSYALSDLAVQKIRYNIAFIFNNSRHES